MKRWDMDKTRAYIYAVGDLAYLGYDPYFTAPGAGFRLLSFAAAQSVLDARVESAGRRVHFEEQSDLPVQCGGDRRLGQRVEVVGAAGSDGNGGRRRTLIRDGARLSRGFFQIGQGEVVRVRIAGALARLGADTGALTDVAGRLLDRSLFESQFFADAVFKEEVGMIDAAGQLGAQ